MGLHRKGIHRHTAGRMHGVRKGGKVSLFNYTPSIAGGVIGIKRFGRYHKLGMPCKNWKDTHMASMVGAASGGGLHAPGSGARMGMGIGSSVKEGRKRILEGIREQFNKRMKS